MKAPVTEQCCIMSCWIPLEVYEAFAFYVSSLYALEYDDSQRAK